MKFSTEKVLMEFLTCRIAELRIKKEDETCDMEIAHIETSLSELNRILELIRFCEKD